MLAVGASCIALTGCGGSGGTGIASTPTPTPAPTPTPTPASNGTITNLVSSQVFATDASTTNVPIDLASGTTGSASASGQTISVAYDASARSYTVTAPGRSASFLPADIQSAVNGETRYAHVGNNPHDYLTIVTTPYTGSTSNRYVAMGYWQRNDTTGSTQSTNFDAFTFGLETAAPPRTGSASWKTDVFGLYTVPGLTPRTIQGSGDFTVDFAKALFTTTTFVTQYDFLTGASLSGGGVSVVAQGAIGSGNSFAGNLAYGGSSGAVSGTINGRFYGPNAEEIGAAFHADNAAGATLNGALTGQRKTTTTPTNFTLDSITSDQLFYSIWGTLDQAVSASGTGFNAQSPLYGQTTFKADGSFTISPPVSNMPSLTFTAADRLPNSRANFVSYQKDVNGSPVRVDLYRPDGSGQAIALTYAGFGRWARTAPDGSVTRTINGYFSYGFVTPRDLLARRTGSGSYDGVAYGTGGADNGARYDIGGTSHFDVDFSNQRYSGSLTLDATPEAGGAAAALGAWQFSANMSYGLLVNAPLSNGGPSNPGNNISPQFYGPDGEEIAAPFSIVTGASINGQNLTIAGVAAAKRH
jgi:hypothetical protein